MQKLDAVPREATFRQRIRRLRRLLVREKVDALLVADLTNIRYLTGFQGSSAFLLVTLKETVFFTDFRYLETAQKEVDADDIVKLSQDRFDDIARETKKRKLRRVAFESKATSHADYLELAGKVGEKRLVPVKEPVEKLRAIKEPQEVAFIRKAVKLTEKALRHIRGFLEPGITEKDLATELEVFFKLQGGEPGFRPVVAFGKRSSMPHCVSSDRRRLRPSDQVLIDLGASVSGYHADLTRTWLSLSMEEQEREIYATVLAAQQAAIEKVRPAVRLASIDAAARELIASKGYGAQFGRGLGHGIGLNVHELPRVSPGSNERCRKGMVFTIEPGIYIPGRGGVRIEDNVLVTDKGCEVLSTFPRTARPFM